MGSSKYAKLNLPSYKISVKLSSRPNDILYHVDETSTSQKHGNFYPKYHWCFEELVGFFI